MDKKLGNESQPEIVACASEDSRTRAPRESTLRFGIYTAMAGMPWGGSEELWSQTAHALLARGHEVIVNAPRWRSPPAPLAALAADGARISWRRRRALYGRSVRRALEKAGLVHPQHRIWLGRTRPDFVLINVGHHLDDMSITAACTQKGIPYAILLQAAGTSHWVSSSMLESYRRAGGAIYNG